jgi:hypothetical protein
LGGQASLRVIWDKYFSEAHGVVFVVDAADEKRVEDARTELDKLLLHPEIADAPVLVFANKRDQRVSLRTRTRLSRALLAIVAHMQRLCATVCALGRRASEAPQLEIGPRAASALRGGLGAFRRGRGRRVLVASRRGRARSANDAAARGVVSSLPLALAPM